MKRRRFRLAGRVGEDPEEDIVYEVIRILSEGDLVDALQMNMLM